MRRSVWREKLGSLEARVLKRERVVVAWEVEVESGERRGRMKCGRGGGVGGREVRVLGWAGGAGVMT